jgi:DNA-binding CsgD family transcriptional regulator
MTVTVMSGVTAMSDTGSVAVTQTVTGSADSAVMTQLIDSPDTRHTPTDPIPRRRTDWNRRPGSMATRLQEQWEAIVDDRSAVATARGWWWGTGVDTTSIHSLDDVLAVVGFQGAREDSEADGRLLHLVRIAVDDDLAARIVLQRILPGLLAIAVRRGRLPGRNATEVFSEIAATAWTLIRTYPCDRRPAKIAANLLRDVEYECFVRRQRMRAWRDEVSVDITPEPTRARDPHAIEQITEVLRDARDAGLAPLDVRFLAELASGRRPDDIGASLGCSPRTVRSRRRVLTRALNRFVNGEDVTWPPAPGRFYAAWETTSIPDSDEQSLSESGGIVSVAGCS